MERGVCDRGRNDMKWRFFAGPDIRRNRPDSQIAWSPGVTVVERRCGNYHPALYPLLQETPIDQ